jgi:ubiquinone/menaquinone biosynthesis C-methylase UbiE
MSEYVLGTSDHELERLELQHEVWRDVTTRILDGLALAPGERVVDLGCGPGFVLAMLRERVGPEGKVLGIDESPRWIRAVRARVESEGWDNVEAHEGRIEGLELVPGTVDLFFMRWVLGFLPDRTGVLRSLARLLRPGGRIVVVDYNHYGVSLFPECESFWAVIRGTRELYATRGGDPWVMGRIFEHFREAGLEPESLEPYVISGPPGSPAFRWAEAFFPFHTESMVEAGVLSEEEREAFLADWSARARDPNALLYSPIVAAGVAHLPAPTPTSP